MIEDLFGGLKEKGRKMFEVGKGVWRFEASAKDLFCGESTWPGRSSKKLLVTRASQVVAGR